MKAMVRPLQCTYVSMGMGQTDQRQTARVGERERHPDPAVEDNRPLVPNRLINPPGQWMCLPV